MLFAKFVSQFAFGTSLERFDAGIIDVGFFTSETPSLAGIDDSHWHYLDIYIVIELQVAHIYSSTLALGQMSPFHQPPLAYCLWPSRTAYI